MATWKICNNQEIDSLIYSEPLSYNVMDLEILREMEVLALKELTIYLRRQCNPVNCNVVSATMHVREKKKWCPARFGNDFWIFLKNEIIL